MKDPTPLVYSSDFAIFNVPCIYDKIDNIPTTHNITKQTMEKNEDLTPLVYSSDFVILKVPCVRATQLILSSTSTSQDPVTLHLLKDPKATYHEHNVSAMHRRHSQTLPQAALRVSDPLRSHR